MEEKINKEMLEKSVEIRYSTYPMKMYEFTSKTTWEEVFVELAKNLYERKELKEEEFIYIVKEVTGKRSHFNVARNVNDISPYGKFIYKINDNDFIKIKLQLDEWDLIKKVDDKYLLTDNGVKMLKNILL